MNGRTFIAILASELLAVADETGSRLRDYGELLGSGGGVLHLHLHLGAERGREAGVVQAVLPG